MDITFVQAIIVSLISAIPPTTFLVFCLIHVVKLGHKVEEVRHATNSMKDQLVKVTGEAERAKGRLEGKAEGKNA